MNEFDRDSLNRIREIFQTKTGVPLAARSAVRRPLRRALVLAAAVICCLSLTAFALNLFSPLSGDQLSLAAVYEGDGVVSVRVENKSGKELRFQPSLKLFRWSTGGEVQPLSGAVTFRNTVFPAGTGGTMTLDLSGAYDLEELEEPLTGDWYYLVLTNQDFVFGQDWTCSVEFAEAPAAPGEDAAPPQTHRAAAEGAAESLRFYFEEVSLDIEDRRAMDAEYERAYTDLFSRFDGTVVPSASPLLLVGDPAQGVVLDESVPPDEQYLLIGEHWLSRDADFKLLATAEEAPLVLSAALPLKQYADTYAYLPLLYVFTYEKAAVQSGEDAAFIYGRLIPFADLERYKVYEDERYVCYEVSELVCSDLTGYAERFAARNPDIRYDSQVQQRVETIYRYYKENMGGLFYYK